TGYRGKRWTMRQFAGFGTPEDTNERYKTLLRAGGTGLSVAFDLPTLMGRDPDHELSLGEVGKCGVNITSLADMETLFAGIHLGDVTTSMTINSPAAMPSSRGCRSSSTRTATSSRRLPSTGRRAGCGRTRCATASARRANDRGSSASTARPPACR